MKNITSLRNHLFDALNRLAEADEVQLDIEINKAASIVQIAETIIKTAEVENQFIAITKGTGSGFIPLIDSDIKLPKIENKPTQEIFNPEEEKNWLMDDGDSTSNTGLQVHTLGLNKND